MRKPLLLFGFFAFVAALPFGCSKMDPVWPDKRGVKVLASFPPIYCMTQKVAGDDANVLCLLSGADPHDYSFDYPDIVKVRGAKLFLCNGLDLETGFLSNLVQKSGQSMDIVVRLADKLPHDEMLHPEHEEHGMEDKHDHHHHGDHDPHVWLSPRLAEMMVEQIAGTLGRMDPSHKKDFDERAEAFKKQLAELQQYGQDAFKNKKNRKIVTQHDSLRYFARDFDLDIVGNIRLQSGIEIDPKGLANLVKKCKDEKVSVITLEPNYSEKEVKSLQATLKAQGLETTIAQVDPLETASIPSGQVNPDPDHYLKTMKANIDNLAKALP